MGQQATAPRPVTPLTVGWSGDGRGVVSRVSGEIDVATAPVLQSGLRRALAVAAPPTQVVVDLRQVTFLGAAGIDVLLESHDRGIHQDTPLRVVAAPALERIMVLAGAGKVLTAADSRPPLPGQPLPPHPAGLPRRR